MKDIRDPKILGENLIDQSPKVRSQYGHDITLAAIYDIHVRHFPCPNWTGDGFMSNNPADHHSGTKQDVPVEAA